MPCSPGEVAAAIDWLLQEHDQFDVLHLFTHLDLLDTVPGNVQDRLAINHLRCSRPEAEALLRQADAHGQVLGLSRRAPRYSAALMQAMVGLRPAVFWLEESLRQWYERPAHQPQLDLFRDNRLLHAEARLRSALIENRLDDAQTELARLPASGDTAALRESWQTLLAALRSELADPTHRLKTLEEELPPMAHRHLGAAAADVLRRLWRQLATRLAGWVFDATQPRLHASHAWFKAREWQQVCECVEAEPQWLSQPVLMQRLIEAQQQMSALHISRRLWLRLCWQHPDIAQAALEAERGDATLNARWQAFLDAEPTLDVVDFPAWQLLVDHSQTHWQPPDDLPERPRAVYGALLALIESGGAIDARRRLHALHPDLLKHYLHGR